MSPSVSSSRVQTLRAWIAATAMLALLAPPGASAEKADPISSSEATTAPSATSSAASEGGAGGDSAAVGDQIVDAVVLRPLGALALAGGAVFFVVTSPLVLVSRVIDYPTSWDVMVVAPWEYTVERPLGDL